MSDDQNRIDIQRQIVMMREEFGELLTQSENKIFNKFRNLQDDTNQSIDSLQQVQEEQKIRVNDLKSSVNSDKVIIGKFGDCITDQKLMSEDIFLHSCKIMAMQKDLISSCTKYDRIFFDNLILPGIIGEGCNYKNLRDYIEVLN